MVFRYALCDSGCRRTLRGLRAGPCGDQGWPGRGSGLASCRGQSLPLFHLRDKLVESLRLPRQFGHSLRGFTHGLGLSLIHISVLAGLAWSFYSILTRKILALGYKSLQVTRRCFFYGLLFMLPCLPFMNFHWDLARFGVFVNWSNVVFLGLGASALCFVAWTFAIKRLGAVQSSVYIYLVPVVTVITAALILQERITGMAALGTALTLAGLVVSEIRQFGVRRKAESLQRRGQENL